MATPHTNAHAANLPTPQVCADAREAVNNGLKKLAQHLKRADGETATIVDAIVSDVAEARIHSAELHARGVEEGNEKLLLVAAKYDEMIINADLRMLELGVKAASNEQQSIDRQLHITTFAAIKNTESRIPVAVKASDAELDKLSQRQQLLAAAQRTATTKDAEFTETPPFTQTE